MHVKRGGAGMSEYAPTTADVRAGYTVMHPSGPGEYVVVSREESDAEFDRWLQSVKAAAWEEGALWAAVECGAIKDERNAWLASGDNPYEPASGRRPFANETFTAEPSPTKPLPKKEQG